MTEHTSSTTTLTPQEQRARLLTLLAHKEQETKLAPLSFSQERFWLEEQLNPGSVNGLSLSVRITGQLNFAALEQSCTEIVRRHEVLRTIFVVVNGQPRQVIKPAQSIHLPVISLEHIPAAERELAAQQAVRAELNRSYDITQGPLFRASLLQLTATDHVLMLMTHHMVSDAWSLGILIHELSVLYEAFSQKQSSPLPPLPWQYANFAQWQREKMQAEVVEREVAYWVKQLSGSSSVLALPYDQPRQLARTTSGAREAVVLPLRLREQLKALAQQHDSTLFMVLLAGLQVLLYRYTGQTSSNVCTVIANRTANDLEKLIGLFLNTLVLRADLQGNLTFSAVLQQARQTTLAAYDHQAIPFQKVLEALQTQPHFEQAALFQVLLTLQNVPNPEVKLSNLDCQRFMREMDFQADMDLTLSLVEAPEGLIGYLQYQTDLFEAATIRRLLGHYQTLLQAMIDNPQQQIGKMPLLTKAEQRQILTTWNETASDYPRERCLHELFERQVEQAPDAIAVVFNEIHVTYRELNRRANQLAHTLRQSGVGPEVLVGLCLERSIEMIVGLVGILKVGGVYVPLDPVYPSERLAFMIQDVCMKVLVTQSSLQENLPESPAVTICLDTDGEALTAECQENLPSNTGADNLVYVMYTSGSTGTPKGIGITQRNVVRLVKNTNYADLIDQTFLQFAPISFDASTLEIWGALLNGGRLIIPPAGVLSLRELGQIIETYEPTIVWLTAGLFHLMIDEQIDSLAHCRQVLAGGDVLSVPHVKRALQAFGTRCQLINGYGPTENTTFTCCYSLKNVEHVAHTVPIGRPIANTTVYLLDRNLQPAPIGVPGELYTGGDGLARGYLNHPELTASKFIPNPFSSEPGARLYKTEDLARYRPDGTIEFLGRNDHQVKIRGFRIELGEIETALKRHPAIQQVVVIAHEVSSSASDKQLVAYLVSAADSPDPAELRHFLQSQLPSYMIPAAFVTLAALPLTSNGKVDRRALPAPDFNASHNHYAPPTTPVEEKLIEIWAEILPVKRIGIRDNFFELGGHSLSATQVIYRLNQAFQLNLPLRVLFEQPTVTELSALIEQHTHWSVSAAPQAITPRLAQRAEAELSLAQQRLWFLDRLMPDSTAYHIPQAVRLTGAIDLPALERSLNEIVRRHESLRTTFRQRGDQPRQAIAPELTLPLHVVDLTALTPADQEVRLQHALRAEAVRLFDLTRGPLLRVTLIKLSEQEHVLAIIMHHIISDGWSSGVFVRELLTAYTAFCGGQPVRLPELPIQYADYAAWQRQWLSGALLDQQLAYWKQQFSGELPVLQLPTDRPRPSVQTFHGAKQSFTLPANVLAALHAVSRRADATLFMTLLAAFQTLLHLYTRQTDLIVGTPIANRTRAETENLIGFFINMLALRIDLSGNPTFIDLLRRVREVTLGAYAHQDLPFDRLVDELHVPRDLSRAPLFQVLFVLQNAPVPAMTLPGLTMQLLEMDNQAAQFDLTLSMTETPHGLNGMLEYNTDLYDAATIQRLIGHLQQLLISIGRQPQHRLADLEWVMPSERQQVLIDWNTTQSRDPHNRCLHELFEERAAQTPDALAIAFEDLQLTYRELNVRAEQLARYLQQHGVGPEVTVGVCQSRSLELLISALGIWKAGGCYMPLDPTLPPARLAFALADAQAALLLTDSRVQEAISFDAITLPIICLDRAWPMITAAPGLPLKRHVDVQQAAYVIYTSGSTGQPKGVLVTHQGLENVLHALVAAWEVTPADRVLQFASINFDASIIEFITGLGTGATLCLAARENLLPGPALAQLLREQHITLMTLTPLALAVLPDEDFPALRLLHVAGEACSLELVQRWAARCRFFNLYGPTENTIWATYAVCQTADVRVTIGRPIAGVQAYILDERLRPLPIGVPGELCLGGAGLARGYLRRSDLTAERFVPHPFSAEPGARLYRTGDRVRYLPDGAIEFLGRDDHQIKIRGFRIELGEIEAALQQHPAVQQAVVVAREVSGPVSNKQLVAYLVASDDLPESEELRRFLQNQLPGYMIPAAFVTLAALPLTPNGKVDRRALPAPDFSTSHTHYVPPETSVEEKLIEIWAEVLPAKQIGIHDNFFELGGHSLLATHVLYRINQTYQLDLTLRSLFEEPTVAGLGLLIEEHLLEEIDGQLANQSNIGESTEPASEEGEL